MSNTDRQKQPTDPLARSIPSRVRRRIIVPAVAVAAAVSLGAVGVICGVAPATAAKTIHAAVTARSRVPAAIMHVAVDVTETTGTGEITRWSDDTWVGYPLGTASGFGVGDGPAGFRQILDHSGINVQTGVFARHLFSRTHYVDLAGDELYDPSRNTIYELEPVYYGPPYLMGGPPARCRRDTGGGGFYVGEPASLSGGPRRWDLRVQADELAEDIYLGGPSRRPFFSGLNAVIPAPWSPCAADEVASQLRTGSAKLVGARTVNGRRVNEFRATDGSWIYYADALSDKPVRLVVRGIYAREGPQGPVPRSDQATLTVNVRTYDQLPFDGNEDLLSLSAQHPGARIDARASDYYAAQARLFPTRRWG